ncbi:MAG: hypothetical protein AAF039_09855 [Bacteroidota bacterium]
MFERILILIFLMVDFPKIQEIEDIYWLRLDTIQPPNTYIYNYPEVEILRITKDSIFLNEFDRTIEVAPRLSKEGFEERNMAVPEFIPKGQDMLQKKLIFKSQENKTDIIESLHVKLIPTRIIGGNALNMVSRNKYKGNLNNVTNVLEFKSTIHIDSIPHIREGEILGDELKLEHFDDFYFLSFYLKGQRFRVIPIYELAEDSIKVYGYNENNERTTFYKF